jgi:hypothetical protein
MAATDKLSHADPTGLDAPREGLAASDPHGNLAPLGVSRMELGPEALGARPLLIHDDPHVAPPANTIRAMATTTAVGLLFAHSGRVMST